MIQANMEVIQTVFDQLQEDISKRLKVLEKQVIFILTSNQAAASAGLPSEDFAKIRRTMDEIQGRLGRMETRLQVVEVGQVKQPERREMATQTTPSLAAASSISAGLEGLLLKPIALPSPALTARSENAVVLPIVQRQVLLQEEEEAEPDEDAIRGEIAERVGGLLEEAEEEDEEQVVEEEVVDEEVVEEVVEEEEQDEAEEEAEEEVEEEEIQLEEFAWKGKTYYKTPDNLLHRADSEGNIEDDPFAQYDPKTNTVKKI